MNISWMMLKRSMHSRSKLPSFCKSLLFKKKSKRGKIMAPWGSSKLCTTRLQKARVMPTLTRESQKNRLKYNWYQSVQDECPLEVYAWKQREICMYESWEGKTHGYRKHVTWNGGTFWIGMHVIQDPFALVFYYISLDEWDVKSCIFCFWKSFQIRTKLPWRFTKCHKNWCNVHDLVVCFEMWHNLHVGFEQFPSTCLPLFDRALV